MTSTHATAPTQFVEAAGSRFAYRRFGAAHGRPVVFLQHFTGTMDFWDPMVTDGIARERPVVLFDNSGVGASGGNTPSTVEAMALDAVALLDALSLNQVDLLGFSLGGFVAQVIAAEHPHRVQRVILAGTGPPGGEGIDQLGAVLSRGQEVSPAEPRLYLFFDRTESSQRAGRDFITRQAQRTVNRDPDSREQSVAAQFDAIIRWGTGVSAGGSTECRALPQPVLVVNGKDDVMVPTHNSYSLFRQLSDARLVLYPDSGHGALFQYADAFVHEGLQFLTTA